MSEEEEMSDQVGDAGRGFEESPPSNAGVKDAASVAVVVAETWLLPNSL